MTENIIRIKKLLKSILKRKLTALKRKIKGLFSLSTKKKAEFIRQTIVQIFTIILA